MQRFSFRRVTARRGGCAERRRDSAAIGVSCLHLTIGTSITHLLKKGIAVIELSLSTTKEQQRAVLRLSLFDQISSVFPTAFASVKNPLFSLKRIPLSIYEAWNLGHILTRCSY